MSATRRLQKELADLKESGLKSFRNIVVDEQNILNWQGLIVPDNVPYNKGAFKIEINFPGNKILQSCFEEILDFTKVEEFFVQSREFLWSKMIQSYSFINF
jgi:hypothetical protein